MRLICFSPAAGSATNFKSWHNRLGNGFELIVVEYPGHGRKMASPLTDSFTDLMASLKTEVQSFACEPFFVFGHSLGALVAFEIASLMRLEGAPLLGCLLSGCSPPSQKRNVISSKPDNFLIDHLRELGGTPSAILDSSDLITFFLRIFRSDLRLIESHVYVRKQLDIPLLVWSSRGDPIAPGSSMVGWEQETSSFFKLKIQDGGHFFIFDDEASFVAELKTEMQTIINSLPRC